MSGRQQVAAYLVLLCSLAVFWTGFDTFGRPVLFALFGIAFVSGVLVVVDGWRKVFGLGKQEASDVDR